MLRIYINPPPSAYAEDGRGSGGIWRVINAEARHLPDHGIEIVEDPNKADVVNIHAGMMINTLKPVVTNSHGLYWTAEQQWDRLYWGYNVECIEALRRANEIIVPSDWVAQPIRMDMKKSPWVIPHGIDPEEFTPQTECDGYVLWAKPRVDVVSDPAPMNELAKLAKDVSFLSTFGRRDGNVQILGAMPYVEFQEVMDRAALWLATSRETGDIASREAMARGIPILGWGWGATAELVRHQETGYLAEPGNFDDLLEGLHYCLKHRKRLGRAAREDVIARFDWRDIMARYAEVFSAAVAGEKYAYDATIVIPAFNYGRFLNECLDSVYRTPFVREHKVEVIVVDDASTDETREVLGHRDEPNLRVLHHATNAGLPASLNTGHRAARGKYISNLDADNLLLPPIEQLFDALEANPSLDVASGNLAFFNPDGSHRPATDWPFGRVSVKGQLDHYNQIASTCMMRARSVNRLGGYRMRQRKNEDGEFWCRAMSAGLRIEQVTDETVFVYRWHGENKSRTEGGEDNPEGPLSWNFYCPWRTFPDISPFALLSPSPDESWPVRAYEQPHIAVVIPCGPGHDIYLMDALDSVYGQTFRDFECIVANDTGAPLDVAAMGHPWVKVVDTGGRKGPAVARNAAIAAAKAPLIVPLDADDMLYPDTLAMFYLEWLQERENIVYGDCEIEDVPGRRDPYKCGPWSWERVQREALYQVTILFAKQWWEAVGGYDTDIDEWEDWIFGLKLHFAAIGASYVPHPWGVYRHWTALDTGISKNLVDNAGYGTKAFDERVARVREYIARKEEEMACLGCKSKAKGRVAGALAKVTSTAVANDGEKWLLVYTGPREGPFSINSRVQRQHKYRVSQHRPFYVLHGDEWIAMVKDIERVQLAPAPVPAAENVEAGPPRPPPIQVTRTPFNVPPTVEEEIKAQTPISEVGAKLGENTLDKLIQAGLTTVEMLCYDIKTNRGRAILDIKGIGPGKLAEIREVVLGG